jgi:Ca2+-binding RTX toxin-like protein
MLQGFAGNDTLRGGAESDFLVGGEGRDTLTGGGAGGTPDIDTFYMSDWHTDAGDTITDFVSGADRFQVSSYWFGIPNSGSVRPIEPSDADFTMVTFSYRPTFLWDAVSATLSYDPDGLGATGAVTLATFSPGTMLSANDIWVG